MPEPVTATDRAARSIALGVLAAGTLVLTGWATGVPALTRLVPTWPALLPLNAVVLVLLAGAVVLQSGRRVTEGGSGARVRVVAGRALALAAGLLAAVVVVGHLTGRWPGAADSMFAGEVSRLPAEFPRRPTAQAGLSALLLAVGTATLRWERPAARWVHPVSVITGSATPLVAVLAYVYTTSSAVEVTTSIGMTVTVALGLALLGLALLLARPDRQPLAWYLHLDDRGTPARLALVFVGLPLAVWLVRDAAIAAGAPPRTALLLGLVTGTVLVGAGVYALSRVQTRAVREELAAERELAAVEEHFRELRGRAPVGMALFDGEGRLIEANPALQVFLGEDEETLRARAWTHGPDVGLGFDPVEVRRLLAGESEEYRTTTRLIGADGAARSADVTVVAVRDRHDRVTNLVCQVVDTTERELAEREVQHLLAERDALLRRLPVGVFRLRMGDDGDRLEYASSVFAAQLGVDEQALLADVRVGLAAIHPDDLGGLLEVLEAARDRSEGFVWEGRTTGAGTTDWVRVEASVSRADDGTPLLEGVQQDVTERRRFERDIIEARAEAEAASRAKSSFLANMSHEIRTPLNAVLGLLGLLVDSDLSRTQRDQVTKATRAARSLLEILNDVLDYSKIEAGRMEVHPEPFDLDGLLRDLGVTTTAALGDKRLDVLFDIDADIPRHVVGDALRLRQVLLNLLGNAVKFTDAGEVRLRVRRTDTAEDRIRLVFAVSDTGIGISPDAQERIFEGFSQAEASTSRRFGGSGLGLTISRHLLQLMGSDLELTSTPGVGSTFAFEVELGRVDPGSSSDDARAALAGLDALVVSDRTSSGEVLARICRSWRWDTSVASSRAAAVAAVAAERFDVVVVDLARDVEGVGAVVEAAARRGEDGPAGRATLVVVTAGVQAGEPAWMESGVDAVLAMPVTASMLFDAVTEARVPGGPAVPEAGADAGRLAGIRVLLAEDNELNQLVAREMLAREGAAVTIVDDGRRAVDAVIADPSRFDVVLMDMQMPVLDGLGATRLLRADERTRPVPIVAMTANATDADRLRCLGAGMDDHLGKPYELDDLVSTVRAWAGGRTAGAGHSTRAAEVPRGRVLDTTAALARVGGDDVFLDRILRRFVERLPESLVSLEDADRQGETEALARAAHSVKGTAATVGAEALADAASELEVVARAAPDPAARRRALAAVSAAASAVRRAVEDRATDPGEQADRPGTIADGIR